MPLDNLPADAGVLDIDQLVRQARGQKNLIASEPTRQQVTSVQNPAVDIPSSPSVNANVPSPTQQINTADYIRQAAIARGMDPNPALHTATTEGGLGTFQVGDSGSSGGPFQLHLDDPNNPGKGNSLGDQFYRDTGKNPLDPKNWQATVDYSLDYAKAHGWDPNIWHGLRAQMSPEEQLLHGWSSSDREQYQKGIADAQSRAEEYRRAAEAAPAGSVERAEALREARNALHKAEEQFQALSKMPPTYTPIDPMQQFASPAFMLAVLGGLFAKQGFTAALGAAGAAMQARNQGNMDQYKLGMERWKVETENALTNVKLASEDIKSILDDEKLSFDEKQAMLNAKQTEWGMAHTTVEDAEKHNESRIRMAQTAELAKQRILEMEALRGPQVEAQRIKIDNYNEAVSAGEQQWLQEHPDQTVVPDTEKSRIRNEAAANAGIVPAATAKLQLDPKIAAFQQFRREHPNATAAEMQGFLQQQYQSRSPMGQILSKYREAYPQATAQDLVNFYAGMQQTLSASHYFTSGQAERVLRSFNAVSQHLEAYRDLMQALQNGDVRLINEAKIRFERATGEAAPVNAQLAAKLLSGEISKAVQGGVGALADREEIQNQLSIANSPEQIIGVVNTAETFVKGQLDSLKQTYDSTGMDKVQPFESRLTPGALKLFGSEREEKGSEKTSGKYHIDQIIEHNGKKYRVTGGDMNDPNVEEVK